MEVDAQGNVIRLDLRENNLSGTLTPEIGQLNRLELLSLPRNQLSGTIPSQIANLINLRHLHLENNRLTGQFPMWSRDLHLLKSLTLAYNQLTGDMSLGTDNLSTVETFSVVGNDLSGCLPETLRDIEDPDLVFSSLNYCNEPPKQPPVTPSFIKWNIGDDVRSVEVRAARLGVQWLFEHAESIGWPIVGNDINVYLMTDEHLAYAAAIEDGTIYDGEIEGLLAYLPSIGGFQRGDSVFNRATKPGEHLNRWRLYHIASVLIHENVHAAFQLDASALYMSSQPHGLVPPRWFTEGMATYFDGFIASIHGGATGFLPHTSTTINGVPVSDIPLTSSEYSDYCSHTCGAFAIDLLVSLVGQRRIIDLHTLGRPGRPWEQTFEEVFGISVPDFYALYDQHRKAGFPKLNLPAVEATQTESGTEDTRIPDHPNDRAALVAFYNATRGNSWEDKTNWLSDQPLATWHGVSVNANGRVQGVSLWGNRLGGSIPPDVGDLTNLKWLYLHDNEIRGTIPERITLLTSLEDLWLGKNQIGGTIPESIDNMTNLQYLDLNFNNISGRLSASMMSMSWLRYLGLENNNLTGHIQNNIGGLKSLEVLNLNGNLLTGGIPDSIRTLSNIRELMVSGNQLTGEFAKWLTELQNLRTIRLSGNAFTGCIPPELLELDDTDLNRMSLPKCN